MAALGRLVGLDWTTLHHHPGLQWEAIRHIGGKLSALRETGASPEEIVQEFPSLESTIDVYGALVHYADHKGEIDANFAEDQQLAAKAERERIERIRP